MLASEKAVLVVVDVQGKLSQLMHGKEELFASIRRCIKGAQALDIPVIWIEQNPEGLGPTVPEISELMTGIKPIIKFSFSCCANSDFVRALKATGRTQVLITGIETHVCICQTVLELLAMGCEAYVVSDAVSSRTLENKQVAIERMRTAGAVVVSVEMALFEMLKEARGDKFKAILKIVK